MCARSGYLATRPHLQCNWCNANSKQNKLTQNIVCAMMGHDMKYANNKTTTTTTKLMAPPVKLSSIFSLTLLAIALFINGNITNDCSGLKLSVSIPELVRLNDAFWLNCSQNNMIATTTTNDHHISNITHEQLTNRRSQQQQQLTAPANNEQQQIYAIKWFKDGDLFYRFLPNASPQQDFYETPGIHLDQAKSHLGNVFIQKADANTEGTFKCEILAEAPHFETVRKHKELKVYAPPSRGPKVEILDANGRGRSPKAEISYLPGDRIDLRCSSAPSRPGARLRWYVNDNELIVAQNNTNNITQSGTPINWTKTHQANYEVRVSPVELRPSNSLKGYYSSHSNLSLLLRREDLRNNTITFKCLASIRLELNTSHRQLIVALASGKSAADNRQLRANSRASRQSQAPSVRIKRSASRWTPTAGPPTMLPLMNSANQHQHLDLLGSQARDSSPRSQFGVIMQPQNNPRPNYALTSSKHRLLSIGSAPASTTTKPPLVSKSLINAADDAHETSAAAASTIFDDATTPNQATRKALYIYEQIDSSFGPSIVENYATLEHYLSSTYANYSLALNDFEARKNNVDDNNNYNYDNTYNEQYRQHHQYRTRWDNGEFVQSLRREQARQRALPLMGWQQSNNHITGSAGQRRFVSLTGLVKSPLHFDELDPLRPVINWPPFESGALVLDMDSKHQRNGVRLLAIPTPSGGGENKRETEDFGVYLAPSTTSQMSSYLYANQPSEPIIEQLLHNLNCSTWESGLDSRLAWTINEVPVASEDTRYFATKISADQRHIGSTIGFKVAQVLANEPKYKITADQLHSSQPIRVGCQAFHSVLLFSSSELITFDFNPSLPSSAANEQLSANQNKNNNNKNRVSSTNNVIQAVSASQASGSSAPVYARPASGALIMIQSVIITMMVVSLYRTNIMRAQYNPLLPM